MSEPPQMKFARRFVYLKGQLIDFSGRDYLRAIYGSTARNLVLRTSRQVEKTTLLALTVLYLAATVPGIQILFVSPRLEQARMFAGNRLRSMLTNSPLLRQALLGNKGHVAVMDQQFANGSCLFVRAAYRSADAARGVSADVLLVDEFQDLAAGDLPVLQETLSHADSPRTILCGTPKLIDNHLEAAFNRSTANAWQIHCASCARGVMLDERSIGPKGIVCPDCQRPLDKQNGLWVPRNPTATWGDGYWINGLMVPWKNFDDILETQRTYDVARFRNEVLGLPVSLGAHVVSREQLEACCSDQPMAQSLDDVSPAFHTNIIAGIDWGGGGVARTVVVVGFARPEGVFEICHLAHISGREDPDLVRKFVADICRRFNVRWIGADGLGCGCMFNRLLLDELEYKAHLYGLNYSASDSPAYQDGVLWKRPMARTGSIGYLISCIQKKKIRFPCVSECGSYLDEFACEVAQYDELNRTIKYTHPATHPDDALHATNYALQMATDGFPGIAGESY